MTSKLPRTMKAWQYTSASPTLAANLKLNTNAPLPDGATSLQADQVLVQVLATSLNPVDYKFPEIPVLGRLMTGSPATPGIDFAGRVAATGPALGTDTRQASSTSLEVGQLMYGRLPRLGLWLLFLTAAFFIIAWLRREHRLDKVEGPRGWPFIGIGITLPRGTPVIFREWGAKYGDLFKKRVGWYNWVVINSPDAFREILEKQATITSSKIPAPMGVDVVANRKQMFTLPYGPKWRTYRSIVHQLVSATMTNIFIPTQEYEAKQLLFDLATKNADQRQFLLHMRRSTFSIIMTSTFGTRVHDWDHKDVKYGLASSEIIGQVTRAGAFIVDELPILARLPTWLQPGRQRALSFAKPLLEAKMRLWYRMLDKLATGKAPVCYAREMIEHDWWRQEGLGDKDAAWIAGGIVEVWAHSPAVALSSIVLHLANNPRVQDVAHEKLVRVVGPHRTPIHADIENLPYIRACFKEVLRLCPTPIWGIKHFSDVDVTYKDVVIPKGTVILANTSFLHYDPSRYDEPYDYRPERYLNHPKTSAEYAAAGNPWQRDHFVFGAGRRICPGMRLAENTVNLAVANMFWAFELRPPLVNGVEQHGMNVGGSAFENTHFRAPNPFSARFLPRSEGKMQLIQSQWKQAADEGYVLRGNDVDIDGVVIY